MIRLYGFTLAALLAVVMAPTASADEGNFALAFPVTPPASEPVFAIELPAEAYATLTSADLTDLLVVDAQGREQPISLHRPPAPIAPRTPLAFPLPLPIPVPGDAWSTPGRLELHVRRDADGRLDALDLHAADGMSSTPGPTEWLIDTGKAASEGIDGLRLTPADEGDFRTLVEIRGSDDLVHWETIHSGLPLLRASEGRRRIERLDVRFASTTRRYLSLRPLSGEGELPDLSSLHGLRRLEADPLPLASVVLTPVGVSSDGLTIDYGRPGPLPVQEAEVPLGDGDGILDFRLEEQVGSRWQTLASGTAWRLSVGGDTLEAAATPLWRNGMGALRLVLGQPAPAPRLVLRYAPDRIVVLANGEPPFRLLAGSARQRHVPVTMADTLAALRQQRGVAWQPPLANLGPATILAGAEALSPPTDPGRWGLWAVLGLGALVVGVLAWRLLAGAGPQAAH
jgi:hypothetical protein